MKKIWEEITKNESPGPVDKTCGIVQILIGIAIFCVGIFIMVARAMMPIINAVAARPISWKLIGNAAGLGFASVIILAIGIVIIAWGIMTFTRGSGI